jgi:hypothetical protein
LGILFNGTGREIRLAASKFNILAAGKVSSKESRVLQDILSFAKTPII